MTIATHHTAPARVLLLGSTGQVGREIARLLPVVALARPKLDLRDIAGLAALLAADPADIIINAAADTRVDHAETAPEESAAANAIAPGIIAEAAARRGALLVHYSTDYVFAGDVPGWRREDDATAPLNSYGRAKLAGEEAIRASGAAHLIFRTAWVYAAHGQNFLRTILKLAQTREALDVVDDQWGAPTSASLIARVTAAAIARWQAASAEERAALSGTYHLVAAGETNWNSFARAAIAAARARGVSLRTSLEQVRPVNSAAFARPAPRPLNSRLDTSKLRSTFGLGLPDWREDMVQVIDELIAAGEFTETRQP